VEVFPEGSDPGLSTVNFAAAQTTANSTIVALPAGGGFGLRNASGILHLVVDVLGWYSAGDTPVAGGLLPDQ
jgi:hypothetical protein